jgi:hypothetical protein
MLKKPRRIVSVPCDIPTEDFSNSNQKRYRLHQLAQLVDASAQLLNLIFVRVVVKWRHVGGRFVAPACFFNPLPPLVMCSSRKFIKIVLSCSFVIVSYLKRWRNRSFSLKLTCNQELR